MSKMFGHHSLFEKSNHFGYIFFRHWLNIPIIHFFVGLHKHIWMFKPYKFSGQQRHVPTFKQCTFSHWRLWKRYKRTHFWAIVYEYWNRFLNAHTDIQMVHILALKAVRMLYNVQTLNLYLFYAIQKKKEVSLAHINISTVCIFGQSSQISLFKNPILALWAVQK